MTERHPKNKAFRDYLQRLIALLDDNPELEPVVMAYNGAFDGESYLHPDGWHADMCVPAVDDVRLGDKGTVWIREVPEKANGWAKHNYENSAPQKVILIQVM